MPDDMFVDDHISEHEYAGPVCGLEDFAAAFSGYRHHSNLGTFELSNYLESGSWLMRYVRPFPLEL
jgi:hypothetical protein